MYKEFFGPNFESISILANFWMKIASEKSGNVRKEEF
jgi:hypothetical protein